MPRPRLRTALSGVPLGPPASLPPRNTVGRLRLPYRRDAVRGRPTGCRTRGCLRSFRDSRRAAASWMSSSPMMRRSARSTGSGRRAAGPSRSFDCREFDDRVFGRFPFGESAGAHVRSLALLRSPAIASPWGTLRTSDPAPGRGCIGSRKRGARVTCRPALPFASASLVVPPLGGSGRLGWAGSFDGL